MFKRFFADLGASLTRYLREVDRWLVIVPFLLSVIGLFAIRSATDSTRYVVVQLIGVGLGLLIMAIVSKIDYSFYCNLWIVVILVASAALFITAAIAETRGGNKNWIDLGFISIQTSEFMKIAFAISMSAHLTRIGKEINRPIQLFLLILHFAFYFLPILLQRDLGTGFVYLMMFAVMLFFSGLYYRYIAIAAVLLVAAVPILWGVLRADQKRRLIYTLQPELDPQGVGWQPIISRIALGSGQLTGLGYGNGIQTQNDMLPASHTDFIYSIIGEEFGFIGCVIVLALLVFLVIRVVANVNTALDRTGSLLCIAFSAMFSAQIFINLGMCLGLTPVIGVTLPFVSYGGSSILSGYIALGIIQAVRIKPDKSLKFRPIDKRYRSLG